MNRLDEVQQAAICKLSWYRLAIGLIQMGLDEDEVDTMSKERLREAWAHMVNHVRDTPSEGGSSETVSARALRLIEELQPERLTLKKLLYENGEREKERERAKRKEREEKEEREKEEERERAIRKEREEKEEREKEKEGERAERKEREEKGEREREKKLEENKKNEERRRKEEEGRRRDAEERAERKERELREKREREETPKKKEEERKRREEETVRREEEEAKEEEEGKKREKEREEESRRKEEKEDYIPFGPETSTNGDWQTAVPSEKELKDQNALMPYSKADCISRAAVAPSVLPGPNKVDPSLKVRTVIADQLAVGQQSETQLKPYYDLQKREGHYLCVKADVLKCKDRVVKHKFELIAFNKATYKVEDQVPDSRIKHYNENSVYNVKLRLIGDARGVTVLGSSFPWSPGGVKCLIAMGYRRMADTRTCGFIQCIKQFHPSSILLEVNGFSPHHPSLKEIAQRRTKLVRWAGGNLEFPMLWKYHPDICHLAVNFLSRQ